METIKDNRQLMKDRPREVCRGCGSKQVHTQQYGEAGPGCVTYLHAQRAADHREIDNLREQLQSYQNVTAKDIENMAQCVTEDLLDLLIDGDDMPVKVETKVLASILEWFNTAGEDHTAGMPEYSNARY